MKINVKHILLSLCAILLLAYVVTVSVLVTKHCSSQLCSSVEWTISDQAQRQYVTEDELTTMLKQMGLYPEGKTLSNISTQTIEKAVLTHPMVRKAQCFITANGTVRIRLSQRRPILRVLTASESYFVDSDRKRMPIRESVNTPVMMVRGVVTEHAACDEIADMVLWINHDGYWREKIQSVHVTNPHYVYLVQKPDETKLILGDIKGYRAKLRKLKTLYEEGFEKIGWRTYREIDLRYKGQAIGRGK